ncbi:GNAT family N-acetyltransferase [Vibrio penaeicida]|uniref:Acetyltransferase n=1 Tax=Vibrio penaeicida TaxID=104609 RepID=A0AAV5P0R1_9VIBR|nr:GNAT family N-acetyltransferase [Vibrio penaeicida]RTZ19426.1 GNAT family N-acetyltransferase [Vibrio penaeicida]GLQ76466.1 acetyltransferase [Vibrio penaeicida]
MSVEFSPTEDASFAEKLTQTNMARYYEKRGIEWNHEMFTQSWDTFENFDIYQSGKRVGVIRFTYETDTTYLRDFQIEAEYQGKGIGAQSLTLAIEHAKHRGSSYLRLRVFSENPAISLYQKLGFVVISEENELMTMELAPSECKL